MGTVPSVGRPKDARRRDCPYFRRYARSCLSASLLILLLLASSSWAQAKPHPHCPGHELRNGRLYVDGEWKFLKIGKPLRNFADEPSVRQLIKDLPILQEKGYNCLELNCYWHHLDKDGNGAVDGSLEPLVDLINAIDARGMFPCLSVETYGVGGGALPKGFWKEHPDAIAINSDGKKVRDSEYGFGSAVPSHFCPAYLEVSRRYIRDLVRGLPYKKLLYFETTVEPQYIGNQSIDYSPHARKAFDAWVAKQPEPIATKAPVWPDTFPVPEAFIKDPVWNQFRAEWLAGWVNDDAQAFRDVAGEGAWVAADYLETGGPEMGNRNGDSFRFLRGLTGIDILQVNWHWHLGTRAPNDVAYENVERCGRDWAVTEHMTLNGSDFRPEEVPALLRATLQNGTRFGWEFVTLSPRSGSAFALYNDDWSPKPLIAVVDEQWAAWLKEAHR